MNCDFKCLQCKTSPDNCLYDDPLIGNEGYDFDPLFEAEFHTEEFKWWREINTPRSIDPGGDIQRCPRCFSVSILITSVMIICKKCEYAEELIDFPCNLI